MPEADVPPANPPLKTPLQSAGVEGGSTAVASSLATLLTLLVDKLWPGVLSTGETAIVVAALTTVLAGASKFLRKVVENRRFLAVASAPNGGAG